MLHPLTIVFVVASAVFALTHAFAVSTYTYWQIWWFDSVMHFWGGILLGLGVHALCTFSRIHVKPTLLVVLAVLILATGSWEVFEWYAGLWDVETYLFDTAKDVILGFAGGLLMHAFLAKRKR